MVIFIGGIHGSGKGTLCQTISSEIGLPHFTASEVLKWDEVSPNMQNKKVVDITETQNRLILGLTHLKKKHQSFILDGHFCLFNKDGNVKKIALEVFQKIAPDYIVFIGAEAEEIHNRLKARDGVEYSLSTLIEMQNIEKKHAREVAQKLNIPYFHITNENLSELLTTIKM